MLQARFSADKFSEYWKISATDDTDFTESSEV